MMTANDRARKDQLREMDEHLTLMIAVADEQRDFLLGALLCDVHAYVIQKYSDCV